MANLIRWLLIVLFVGPLAIAWGQGGVPPDSPLESGVAEASTGAQVLFSTSFDRGRPKGMAFDREGVWSVVDGKLRAELPDRKQQRSFAYVGSDTWTDYNIDVDILGERGVDKGIAIRISDGKGIGIDLRSDDYNDVVMYRGYTQLGRAPAINRNGRWQRLRVEVQGSRYRVYVNRALKLEYVDTSNERPNGKIALAAYTGGRGACVVWFDNLVVTRAAERT